MVDIERHQVLVKWRKPNEGYVQWDIKTKEWTVGQDNYDIINVDSIICAWKLRGNAKEDKVNIYEKGHMNIKIYQQKVGIKCML